jgi:hypothetical protein
MSFVLLWNYVAGRVYFCRFAISMTRAYEESAAIEIDPVGIARNCSNEDDTIKLVRLPGLFLESQNCLGYQKNS